MPDAADRDRWNERHAAAIAAGRGTREPVDWLLEHAELLEALPRGRALDVACGLGRHALHLAAMGFAVDAVDVSDVAVAHTARQARERGLAVRARVVDLAVEAVPAGPYEVVVNTFFLDRRVLGALPAAVAPGGVLLVDTFVLADGEDLRYRLRPGELRAALADLELVDYREGPPGPGERPRARAVARRRPLAVSGRHI